MTILLFANQAQTTLAQPVNSSQTTITVASGTGVFFPAPQAGQAVKISLVNSTNNLITEVLLCTNITGNVLTVQRAQEGTIARAWSIGDFVINFMTAGTANAFVQTYGLENKLYSASFVNMATETGQVTTTPTNANDLTNKQYVDSLVQGIQRKFESQVATTAPITLFGLQEIDTYTTLSGDYVLVKNQGDLAENGIYVASSGAWSRIPEMNTWNEVPGTFTFIQNGFTNINTGWVTVAPQTGTIDVTPIVWGQFSSVGGYTAGTGLTLSGNQFSITNTGVAAASYGTASSVPTLQVNAQGQIVSASNTTISISANQINSLIQNAGLQNSSITIGSTAVSLGGTLTSLAGVTISGLTNTLTNIANNSLVYDSITINGSTIALGGSATIKAVNPYGLTIGTGLSGSSYDGSSAVTVAIANTGVTANSYGSASQALTATVNAQGQLTSLAASPIAIANTQVSGLGTASTMDAGVANGVATLDSSGTLTLSQIPASLLGALKYQGTWNASTNTPTLTSSVGTQGFYYVVSVAGSTNLNGVTDWQVNDWAIFNGSVWQKIDNTDLVTSVNGYTGTVVLSYSDVGAPSTFGTNATGTWNIGITGNAGTVTNGVYTTGSYADPSWITSIATTKLSGTVTNSQLANSTISGVSLGSNLYTLTIGSGLGGTSYNGSGAVTITNTAPDQIVSLTGAGTTVVTGTYPNFTITSNDAYVGTVTSITAGTGLNGGTITTSGTISLANTTVVAASYGAASKTLTATVNAQGQLTALSDTPIAIANTQVSGLGTMSTQNYNAISITGGNIDGTVLGATTAAAAHVTTLGVSGLASFSASTTGHASINIPSGAEPSAPVTGDMWTNTTGLYYKSNSGFIEQLDIGANTPGVLTQPTITITGSGATFNASSVNAVLFSLPGWSGDFRTYVIPAATGLALVDQSANYLVVSYNAGNPVYSVVQNVALIDNSSIVGAALLWRNGTQVHFQPIDWGRSTASRLNRRVVQTNRYQWASGLALGESTGNVITLTSGVVWYGVDQYNETSQTSASSNAEFWYHSVSVWTQSIVSTYNNTQYDNGTNLASLGPNDYAVNWVYRYIDGSGLPKLAYILGTASYGSLAAAAGSTVPVPPPILSTMAILVGRIIVKNGAATASAIDSAFTTAFTGSAVSDHNSLGGLQGGTTSQYYHLTGTEYTGTGTGTFVRATSPTLVTPNLGTPSALTLTNATGLPNAGLVNSSITINGSTVSLGGSTTVTATATNALTIGTGLSGTSYNGSTAVTIALANTAVTAGSYTNASITVDAQGRLTSALSGTAPVTSISVTAPITTTGGTTPTIGITQASTSTNGYLSSTDWNTFNNKQPAGSYVTSVSGTTGRITSTGGTTPVIDLASGIATAGTTGSSTLIPVVTIDTYGRVTSITTAANPQGTVTSVGGTGTVNGLTLTGTVTSSGNLTLGGTLSGIANSALTNSSITINGNSVSLGGSTTVTASTTNALTFNNSGTGVVSGSTFNGGSAVTVSYNTLGASPLAGSSSLVTLGTVTTGTWNATPIANSYLANSTISGVSLGSNLSALTIGTGLSGTSYNGSSAITIANTGVLSFSGGTTGLTPNSATTGAVTLGGTLNVSNGGTGLTSLTSGYIPYGNGTGALSSSANLTFDGVGAITLASTNSIGAGNATANKNYLDNGNFDVWQAGRTASTNTANNILPDRWQYINDGTNGSAIVFSQQTFTLGQTAVPNNPKYYLNWVCTNVTTPSNYIRQRIEGVNTLQGQQITISAWVKIASGTALCGFSYQQEFGSGGSPSAGYYPSPNSFTITTTWQKFTFTTNVASIAGKTLGTNGNDAINICLFAPVGGFSGTISVSQFQCEIGPVATSFDLRPIEYELMRSQRHYLVLGAPGNTTTWTGVVEGTGTTKASVSLGQFPVTMRAIPNMTFTGVSLFSPASGSLSGWTVSASRCSTTSGAVWANMTLGVAGQACVLYIPASGYITFDAQL